jgi:UDP-glucose 4-epimerase
MEELRGRGIEPIPFDRANGQDVLTGSLPQADHVIHLAGLLGTHELFDDVHNAIDVNIKGTVNVLDWCKINGSTYTGIVMPDVFPSIYTATKIAAQRFADAWHVNYGVPVSHVRAFNAFGPGQKHGEGHPQKIIPTFAVAAWEGKPIPIWGDGAQTVDLIHTSDLARMLVDAMSFGNGEVFDGGTGTPQTVLDVAHHVRAIAESDSKIQHLPMRRGELPTQIVATGEGWDLLDWKPEFRLNDLIVTVESYE